MELADQELVRRMLAGDPGAIEDFYQKYCPRFMLIAA